MIHIPDVDIDFADRSKILEHIKYVPASMIQKNELVQHASGIYMCNIPVDPKSKLSSIPYKEAEVLGYQKIDFLNCSTYADVKSEEHLNELMNKEPIWDMLKHNEVLKLLPHVSGHMYAIEKIDPKSITDLAMVIAIIRPAKRYLLNCSIDKIASDIWKISDGYQFKKSHAIAYAASIVVSMNLLTYDTL